MNAQPVLTALWDDQTSEGQTYYLWAEFSDSDNGDTHTAVIDWGDGIVETITAYSPDNDPMYGYPGTIDASHDYADDGTYTVTVTVSDSLASGSDSMELVVLNEPPDVWISGLTTALVDEAFSLDLSASDVGDDTVTQWSIDWGDGQTDTVVGSPSSVTHTYTTAGSYEITASASDEDGVWTSNPHSVLIGQSGGGAAPQVDPIGDVSLAKGEGFWFSASFTDDDWAETHTATIDWGDGVVEPLLVSEPDPDPEFGHPGMAEGMHSYSLGGVFTAKLTVNDSGGISTERSFSVTVTNATPVIVSEHPDAGSAEGEAVPITVRFTDEDDAAGFVVTLDWGDGTTPSTLTATAVDGEWSAGGEHVYADDGQHTVEITVADASGAVASESFVQTVMNVAPTLSVMAQALAAAGSTYTLYLSATDPGDDALTQWTIHWGDGSAVQTVSGSAAAAQHMFSGSAVVEIFVTATDEDGSYTAARRYVQTGVETTADYEPFVAPLPAISTRAGQTWNLAGTVIDGDGDSEALSVVIDWGDGQVSVGDITRVREGQWSVTADHAWSEPGTYSAMMTITEHTGESHSRTMSVWVLPSAVVTATGAASVAEASSYSLELAAANIVPAEWTIDWGDGSIETVPAAGQTLALQHVYADGNQNVVIEAVASDGAQTFAAEPLSVSVLNVAPVVQTTGALAIELEEPLQLSVSFADVGTDTVTAWGIDWGDGTIEQFEGVPEYYAEHFYASAGSYPVTGFVIDEDGRHDSPELVARVGGAGAVWTSGDRITPEGSVYQLELHTDGTPITSWTIDWGDGSISQTVDGALTSVTHVYADGADTFEISVTATDGVTNFNTRRAVYVQNVAPELTFVGAASTGSYESYALTFSAADSGTDQITQWTIDWGDGSAVEVVTAAGSLTHVFTAAGLYRISAEVVDEDGTWSRTDFVVTVHDEVTIVAPATVVEGAPFTLNLHDTGHGATGWLINWGDGVIQSVEGDVSAVEHTYPDGSASFTIRATAAIPSGAAEAHVQVTVANAPPAVELLGPDVVAPGTAVTYQLHVIDAGQDTALETWTVDWGDGTIETITDGLEATHTYAAVGDYAITATVTDEDGAWAGAPRVMHVSSGAVELSVLEDDGEWLAVHHDDAPVLFQIQENLTAPQREFRLTNSGASDLVVSLAVIPAGFVIEDGWTGATIAPGASTTITIIYDSSTASAPAMSAIEMTTSDPERPQFTLNLVAQDLREAPLLSVTVEGQPIDQATGLIDLGNASLGAVVTRTVNVTNAFSAAVMLDPMLIVPSGFEALPMSPDPVELLPGASASFEVRLMTEAPRAVAGTAWITGTTGAGEPIQFRLGVAGRVAQPELRISSAVVLDADSAIDFGSTDVGTPLTRTITIGNTGTAAVAIAPEQLLLPEGFELSVSFAAVTLESGMNADVQVSFDPSIRGEHEGDFVVVAADGAVLLRQQVLGLAHGAVATLLDSAGQPLEPLIDRIDFGHAALNTAVSRTLTIRNDGDAALVLTDPASVPAGFRVASPLGSTMLLPGESTMLTLELFADAAGRYVGTVAMITNDRQRPRIEVPLGGGVGLPQARLSIEHPLLIIDDGDAQFSTSGLLNRSTTGYGDDALWIEPDAAGASTVWSFRVQPGTYRVWTMWTADAEATTAAAYTILDADDLLEIAIVDQQIAPQGADEWSLLTDSVVSESGLITVRLDGSSHGRAVADAIRIQRIDSMLDFGHATSGQPLTQTLTLTNDGEAELVVSDAEVPAGFSLIGLSTPLTISPHDSATLTVHLDAVVAGQYGGDLTLTTNDPDRPVIEIGVEGQIDQPHLQVAHAGQTLVAGQWLHFGPVTSGATHTRPLTLKNSGSAPLEFDVPVLPAGFTLADFPASIPAGGRATVTVTLSGAAGVYGGEFMLYEANSVEPLFTLNFAGSVVELASVGLFSDTGTPADNITADPQLTGTIAGAAPADVVIVQFDLDGDGVVDASTTAGPEGVYRFTPIGLAAGAHTVAARVHMIDSDDAEHVGPWTSLTFTLQDTGNAAPVLTTFALQTDDGVAPDDQVTTDATLTGSVTNDGSPAGLRIEFDVNGDSLTDYATVTDSAGAFEFTLPLTPGSITASARVVEMDYAGQQLAGSWSTLNFTLEEAPPPAITSFTLAHDTGVSTTDGLTFDPSLTGVVTAFSGDAAEAAGLAVQLDLDLDGVADHTAYTDGEGRFDHRPIGLTAGVHEVRARLLGGETWSTLTFELEATPFPRVAQLSLDYESTDTLGATADPQVSGYIVTTGPTIAGLSVDFDHNGDGLVDGSAVTEADGSFTYRAEGLALDANTLTALVRDGAPETAQITFTLLPLAPVQASAAELAENGFLDFVARMVAEFNTQLTGLPGAPGPGAPIDLLIGAFAPMLVRHTIDPTGFERQWLERLVMPLTINTGGTLPQDHLLTTTTPIQHSHTTDGVTTTIVGTLGINVALVVTAVPDNPDVHTFTLDVDLTASGELHRVAQIADGAANDFTVDVTDALYSLTFDGSGVFTNLETGGGASAGVSTNGGFNLTESAAYTFNVDHPDELADGDYQLTHTDGGTFDAGALDLQVDGAPGTIVDERSRYHAFSSALTTDTSTDARTGETRTTRTNRNDEATTWRRILLDLDYLREDADLSMTGAFDMELERETVTGERITETIIATTSPRTGTIRLNRNDYSLDTYGRHEVGTLTMPFASGGVIDFDQQYSIIHTTYERSREATSGDFKEQGARDIAGTFTGSKLRVTTSTYTDHGRHTRLDGEDLWQGVIVSIDNERVEDWRIDVADFASQSAAVTERDGTITRRVDTLNTSGVTSFEQYTDSALGYSPAGRSEEETYARTVEHYTEAAEIVRREGDTRYEGDFTLTRDATVIVEGSSQTHFGANASVTQFTNDETRSAESTRIQTGELYADSDPQAGATGAYRRNNTEESSYNSNDQGTRTVMTGPATAADTDGTQIITTRGGENAESESHTLATEHEGGQRTVGDHTVTYIDDRRDQRDDTTQQTRDYFTDSSNARADRSHVTTNYRQKDERSTSLQENGNVQGDSGGTNLVTASLATTAYTALRRGRSVDLITTMPQALGSFDYTYTRDVTHDHSSADGTEAGVQVTRSSITDKSHIRHATRTGGGTSDGSHALTLFTAIDTESSSSDEARTPETSGGGGGGIRTVTHADASSKQTESGSTHQKHTIGPVETITTISGESTGSLTITENSSEESHDPAKPSDIDRETTKHTTNTTFDTSSTKVTITTPAVAGGTTAAFESYDSTRRTTQGTVTDRHETRNTSGPSYNNELHTATQQIDETLTTWHDIITDPAEPDGGRHTDDRGSRLVSNISRYFDDSISSGGSTNSFSGNIQEGEHHEYDTGSYSTSSSSSSTTDREWGTEVHTIDLLDSIHFVSRINDGVVLEHDSMKDHTRHIDAEAISFEKSSISRGSSYAWSREKGGTTISNANVTQTHTFDKTQTSGSASYTGSTDSGQYGRHRVNDLFENVDLLNLAVRDRQAEVSDRKFITGKKTRGSSWSNNGSSHHATTSTYTSGYSGQQAAASSSLSETGASTSFDWSQSSGLSTQSTDYTHQLDTVEVSADEERTRTTADFLTVTGGESFVHDQSHAFGASSETLQGTKSNAGSDYTSGATYTTREFSSYENSSSRSPTSVSDSSRKSYDYQHKAQYNSTWTTGSGWATDDIYDHSIQSSGHGESVDDHGNVSYGASSSSSVVSHNQRVWADSGMDTYWDPPRPFAAGGDFGHHIVTTASSKVGSAVGLTPPVSESTWTQDNTTWHTWWTLDDSGGWTNTVQNTDTSNPAAPTSRLLAEPGFSSLVTPHEFRTETTTSAPYPTVTPVPPPDSVGESSTDPDDGRTEAEKAFVTFYAAQPRHVKTVPSENATASADVSMKVIDIERAYEALFGQDVLLQAFRRFGHYVTTSSGAGSSRDYIDSLEYVDQWLYSRDRYVVEIGTDQTLAEAALELRKQMMAIVGEHRPTLRMLRDMLGLNRTADQTIAEAEFEADRILQQLVFSVQAGNVAVLAEGYIRSIAIVSEAADWTQAGFDLFSGKADKWTVISLSPLLFAGALRMAGKAGQVAEGPLDPAQMRLFEENGRQVLRYVDGSRHYGLLWYSRWVAQHHTFFRSLGGSDQAANLLAMEHLIHAGRKGVGLHQHIFRAMKLPQGRKGFKELANRWNAVQRTNNPALRRAFKAEMRKAYSSYFQGSPDYEAIMRLIDAGLETVQ